MTALAIFVAGVVVGVLLAAAASALVIGWLRWYLAQPEDDE